MLETRRPKYLIVNLSKSIWFLVDICPTTNGLQKFTRSQQPSRSGTPFGCWGIVILPSRSLQWLWRRTGFNIEVSIFGKDFWDACWFLGQSWWSIVQQFWPNWKHYFQHEHISARRCAGAPTTSLLTRRDPISHITSRKSCGATTTSTWRRLVIPSCVLTIMILLPRDDVNGLVNFQPGRPFQPASIIIIHGQYHIWQRNMYLYFV